MNLKEGDRVRISGNEVGTLNGTGTIVNWDGNIKNNANKYHVRLDHWTYHIENDNHSIDIKYIRKLTKLDKALK